MLLDCPYWVKHGDDGINGLDVSPNGRRLATCGRNIIIWNMLPILDSKAELDPDVPKVLAIMQEQEKGVLTVKFSNSGRFLAAGSSYPDNSVLIFKQVASPATTNMSIKFTGKENWRPTAAALKHHINDVTSLSWSPGDEYLASGAMDGNIMVWKVNQDGRCQLHHSIDREHNGWVKGLAFDPIGRYLATQGRNGVKVWDMQRGWALVSHMQKPFEGAVEQGLRYRTSWSPDGEILIAANGFEHQQRTICTFQRQTWEVTEMVGHQGAVLVVAANPRLFYPPVQLHDQRRQQNDEDEQPGGSGGAAAAAARGGSKAAALLFGDEPCSVFAAGSTDKTISMWNTELPRAVIRVSQVHSGAFVDMAWTPDGYTLIAAAGDDKVSVMRFGLSEMGKALTEAEFRNVLDSEYNPAAAAAGDGQAYGAEAGLQTQEDAALAALALQEDMAAAMNVAFPTPPRPARHPSNAAAAACAGAPLQLFSGATGTAAAAAPAGVMPAPVRQAAAAAAGPVGGMSGGALERRLMPQGGGATTGTLAQPRQQQQQSAGQKRLHPTSTHGPAAAAAAAAGGSGALGYPAKRPSTGPQQQQGMMRPAGGVSRGSGWVLSPPAIPFRLETMVALMTEHQHQGGQQYQSVVLLVENQRRGAGSSSAAGRGGGAEVSLHLGGLPGHVLWTDRTPEPIVAAAGTAYFAAAATASGLLYTWRGGGNALLPPLALGSPPVSMSAQGHFQLLVVGADGSILTLDLEQKQRQFCGPVPAPNLAAVLAASAPGTGLKEAWLTSGSSASPGSSSSSVQVPIGRTQAAVLTDSSAWLFHPQLGLWVMLAPPAGLASAPAQLAANALPSTATLAPHPDADKLRSARAAVATSQQVQQGVEAVWLRQEAACQLTAAELLGDTLGYQRWLKQLVLLLARQNEPMRLHELCQDLLGPERWDPSMVGHAWSPKVIGLEKRIMLDHLVIPTMAKEKLAMATQVHACLQAAQEHARQATGRLVASGWRLQPASSAASPAAAAAGLQQQPPAPSTMPGRDAATPGSNNHAAVGAMVGSQQQPQQADMAALSAQTHPWQLQANASAGQQQQQQQQSGLQAAAAAANGTPQGAAVVAPRRLQAMPIGPLPPQPQAQQQQWPSQQGQLPQQQQGNGAVQHQQQQQAGAWPPVGPGPANGVEAAVRIPLQEQQQPHALTQQATPGKQQQPLQPAEKPAASGPAVEPGMQNS